MKRLLVALAASGCAALAACGGGTRPATVPVVSTKLPAEVGEVVAIAEVGDATVVFERERALVVRADTIAASVQAPRTWAAGATIAALDGEGSWAVGISGGRLYRITLAGDLEDITDRFRLADDRRSGNERGSAAGDIHGIAAAGTTTAFSLADGVAVTADGLHELRAKLATPTAIAASRGRIAMIEKHGIAVWDLARANQRTYPIAARSIAFVGGRLAAATSSTVYLEDGAELESHATELRNGEAHAGELHDLHLPAAPTAIAAAGPRLWILTAGALYAVDGTTLRRATLTPPRDAQLYAATGGDAWLAGHGSLTRASLATATEDPAWRAQIQPVFQRVCAHCHLPGGSAGIDLSTAAAWHSDHDELVRRVVVTRTMPPAGTDLTAADRDALAAWLTSQGRGAASTSR